MRWDSKDERNRRVDSASGWLRIDDFRRLQGKPGVFIFADDSLSVEYVGSTGSIFNGVNSAIRLGKDRQATQVKALYTGSSSEAEDLAEELVRVYRPWNN